MKKTLKNTLILGIIFFPLSLLTLSCSDKDIDIHNYQFSATLETLDAQGTQFIVYQPVKFRLKLNNLAERKDKITFSYDIGERKGYIYFDDPEVKHLPNTTIENDFVNDQLVFNYLPQNGGNQTIKITVNNGAEYSFVLEKELIVNSGAVIDFIDPLSFLTNLPTIPINGNISVSNNIDEDNYFNITFRIISGTEHNVNFSIFDASTLNLITSTSSDTVRILTGLGNVTMNYVFTQLLEGRSPIEITIIDRYGNVEKRNYNFSYFPTIELEIIGYGLHTGYYIYDVDNNPIGWNNYWIPPIIPEVSNPCRNSLIAIVNATDIATNSPYTMKADVQISFDLQYRYWKYIAIDGGSGYSLNTTETVNLSILANTNSTICDIYSIYETEKTTSPYFHRPVKIDNFNFVFYNYYDNDGRKFIIKDNKIKWFSAKNTVSAPDYSFINDNNATGIWYFDIE
jgi:hypothetical protein